MIPKLGRRFSAISGVSNNMLVTLSLGHLSSKTFSDHTSMVEFLAQNGFLNFTESKNSMMSLDRKSFLKESTGASDTQNYALKAQNFSKGVDISNPLMQALMLDCVLATVKGCDLKRVNMLDIGAATGYLTFSAEKLVSGLNCVEESKFTGIDLSSIAIQKAESLKSVFHPKNRTQFMVDDFYNHLEVFNKYNLIVSGCGLTQADVVGSIVSKIHKEEELVLIAPVFTSAQE